MHEDFLFFNYLAKELSLSEQEIIDFSGLFEKKKFSPSEYLLHEGDINHKVGFVLDGILRGFICDEEGREANLRFIGKYDFVCSNFARGVPGSMNIQSITSCSVYFSNWKTISQFLETYPSFKKFFNQLLAKGHSAIIRRLSSYIRNNASERYRLFLEEYPNLINTIPHHHVANFIGVTPVQLSRVRRKWVKHST